MPLINSYSVCYVHLQDPIMMSNAPEKYARYPIWKRLNGFGHVEVCMYVCAYLGVFDNYRRKILEQISSKSADWLYSPQFLHESVLIPCYNIGLILAKKYHAKIPDYPGGTDSKKWRKDKTNFESKYNIIAFLLSFEMVLEYFKILRRMKQSEIDRINLTLIFGNAFWSKSKHLHLSQYGKLMFPGYDKYTVNLRSHMYFSVTDQDKLSAVLKAMPLAYFHVQFDKSDCEHEHDESFTHSSQTLERMYNYQSFWDRKNGHLKAEPLNEENWLDLPNAMRPSEWYDDIFYGPNLLQYNRAFMARDILKLSANFTKFDMHQENVDGILEELLRITEENDKKEPDSPPAVVPHQIEKITAPPVPAGIDLTIPGLEQPPQLSPGANVQERGEIINDPRTNVTTLQSVQTQRLFGYMLCASNSFDFATYCSTAIHGDGYQNSDEHHRTLTPPPGPLSPLGSFTPPQGSPTFPSPPPTPHESPVINSIGDMSLDDSKEDDDANFVTDAGTAAASLAATSATAPAGKAIAATAPTQADVPTTKQPTGLVNLALAAQHAPNNMVDGETTESASTTPMAGLKISAGLPVKDIGVPKQAPLTMQSAAPKKAPESTKKAGPSKASQQESEPQARSASDFAKQTFRLRIPADLSDWYTPTENAAALLDRKEDWKLSDVGPTVLRNLALHCKNRYQFYKQPCNSRIIVYGKTVGKYQLAFYNQWRLSREIFAIVSTQNLAKERPYVLTCSY